MHLSFSLESSVPRGVGFVLTGLPGRDLWVPVGLACPPPYPLETLREYLQLGLNGRMGLLAARASYAILEAKNKEEMSSDSSDLPAKLF